MSDEPETRRGWIARSWKAVGTLGGVVIFLATNNASEVGANLDSWLALLLGLASLGGISALLLNAAPNERGARRGEIRYVTLAIALATFVGVLLLVLRRFI